MKWRGMERWDEEKIIRVWAKTLFYLVQMSRSNRTEIW